MLSMSGGEKEGIEIYFSVRKEKGEQVKKRRADKGSGASLHLFANPSRRLRRHRKRKRGEGPPSEKKEAKKKITPP